MILSSFDFDKNYLLEDNRALLQPLNENNSHHLLHFSLNEPDIWQFSLIPMQGEENFNKYIQATLQSRIQKIAYPFIVFDKRTNQYAGSTRFYDIQLNNSALQLGYTWYGKQFQRTGLNRHSKYLLLQFAFETMGMQRVEFRADNNNLRSINAMKAIGCTVEGVLRSNVPNATGGRRDSIVLSILRHEWFTTVKADLEERINSYA